MATVTQRLVGPPAALSRLITEENYMWWAAVPVVLGTFVVMMDSSIVNVATSHIMNDFGSNVETIEWVSTGYMLSSAVMMPTTGFLGDRFGKKRLYVLAIALFTIASMLCGAAWDANSLIGFRVLQGLVGGAIQPVSQAILYETFPLEKRGFSQVLVGVGAMLAPMLGPTVGGYLVDGLSWRWIFYVNLPFGILATLMAHFILKDSPTRRVSFDYIGFSLMATFLTTALMALSDGNSKGWGSDYVVTLLAIALVAFCGFLVSSFWKSEPIVKLDLFKYATYTAGALTSVVVGIGMFGGMFILPLFLQGLMGYTAIRAGIMMIPQGLGLASMMILSGRLFKGIDARIPMIAGMGMAALSLMLQSKMTPDTAPATIAFWIFLRGAGLGMAFPFINQLSLGAVPLPLIGQAAGLFNVVRQIGGSVGIALLSTILTQRIMFHEAIMGQDAARTGTFGQIAGRLSDIAIRQGADPLVAQAQAQSTVAGSLISSISVAAYQDVFWFAGIIMLLGIIPALFVRPRQGVVSAEAEAAGLMLE